MFWALWVTTLRLMFLQGSRVLSDMGVISVLASGGFSLIAAQRMEVNLFTHDAFQPKKAQMTIRGRVCDNENCM